MYDMHTYSTDVTASVGYVGAACNLYILHERELGVNRICCIEVRSHAHEIYKLVSTQSDIQPLAS